MTTKQAIGESWYQRQPIVQKLRIGFGSILTLTLILGVGACGSLIRLGNEVELYAELSADALLASEINADVAKSQMHAERYMVSREQRELEQSKRFLSEAKGGLALANVQITRGNRAAMVDRIHQGLSHFEFKLAELERSVSTDTSVVLQTARSGKSAKLARDITQDAVRLTMDAAAIKNSLIAEEAIIKNDETTVIATMEWAIAILVLASLAVGVFISQKVGSGISQAIKSLSNAMLALARGDRDVVLPDDTRSDEVGDMARSLVVFKDNLFEIERLEAQRVSTHAEQRDTMLGLAEKFETTVGQVVGGVAAASQQLQSTASSMAMAADESSNQTDEISDAIGTASAGVTSAAAASDEFALSIGEISQQAEASAGLAREATSVTREADAKIAALTASAEQIGRVIELISTIAQRTNLLAINASIEAARGGEAGRGFAVVASEVKDLAGQTSRATKLVEKEIREIQESTEGGVRALQAISEKVNALEIISVSIAAAVDQQSVAGRELAQNVDMAARGANQVASNIAQVRKTALLTGSAATQMLASSTDLQSQAETLHRQAEAFLWQIKAA